MDFHADLLTAHQAIVVRSQLGIVVFFPSYELLDAPTWRYNYRMESRVRLCQHVLTGPESS